MMLSEGVDICQSEAAAPDGERGLEQSSGQPQGRDESGNVLPVAAATEVNQMSAGKPAAESELEAASAISVSSAQPVPILSPKQWFVMRDLKRANAKLPAYKQFIEAGIEVFTPMHTVLKTLKGKQRKVTQPFIRDLLFVHDSRTVIDPIVELTPTLQYRFERGKGYMVPMTVRDEDMKKFLLAVSSTRSAVYMLPDEMNPKMIGRTIRIAGGPLEGCTGKLVSIKGSRAKRLLVEIPGILAACVEVEARYVEIL